MGAVNKENLTDVLSYHTPSMKALEAIQSLRNATEDMIATILEFCPDCADRSAAIRHVREAMMTANASIALEGKI